MRWPLAIFLLVHTTDNRDVLINSEQVIYLHEPGKQLAKGSRCVVGLAGHFFVVVETCQMVRGMIERPGQ